MWAFSRPVLAHCATNSRCDLRAIVRVTHSDSGTVSTVISRQQRRDRQHHHQHGHHGQHRRQQLADRHRQRRLDVVDVVGDPAEHLAALSRIEVGQRQPVHLVLDIGAQRNHRALHGDVQQPCLHPDQQRGKQIQPKRQQQRAAYRAEVDADARRHVRPRQQVGERAVTAGARGLDRLLLGDARGQLTPDDAVEQQVGGVPEDARADHADRDAARWPARSPPRSTRAAESAASPAGSRCRGSRGPLGRAPAPCRASASASARSWHASPRAPDRSLRVGELGVLRAVGEQRLVRAGADHAPVVDDDDLVGLR